VSASRAVDALTFYRHWPRLCRQRSAGGRDRCHIRQFTWRSRLSSRIAGCATLVLARLNGRDQVVAV